MRTLPPKTLQPDNAADCGQPECAAIISLSLPEDIQDISSQLIGSVAAAAVIEAQPNPSLSLANVVASFHSYFSPTQDDLLHYYYYLFTYCPLSPVQYLLHNKGVESYPILSPRVTVFIISAHTFAKYSAPSRWRINQPNLQLPTESSKSVAENCGEEGKEKEAKRCRRYRRKGEREKRR